MNSDRYSYEVWRIYKNVTGGDTICSFVNAFMNRDEAQQLVDRYNERLRLVREDCRRNSQRINCIITYIVKER